MTDPIDLLTSPQAAKVLGLTRQRIHHFRTSGLLRPAGRLGHVWVYRRADVARLAGERAQARALRPAQ